MAIPREKLGEMYRNLSTARRVDEKPYELFSAGVAGEIAFRVSEAALDVVKSLETSVRRLAAQNVVLPQGCDLA